MLDHAGTIGKSFHVFVKDHKITSTEKHNLGEVIARPLVDAGVLDQGALPNTCAANDRQDAQMLGARIIRAPKQEADDALHLHLAAEHAVVHAVGLPGETRRVSAGEQDELGRALNRGLKARYNAPEIHLVASAAADADALRGVES
nr:unnamed protein product [Digitaria exilis]